MSEPHRDMEAPCCGEWIEILPTTGENFDCPWCNAKLHLDVDAEFENGSWHDLSKLSVVEYGCEHKYAERDTSPLGVKCVKCGHFVGAHE